MVSKQLSDEFDDLDGPCYESEHDTQNRVAPDGKDFHNRIMEYRLDCGRTVRVEELYVSVSKLGFLAGRAEAIRSEVIKRLPERVHEQFPVGGGFIVKAVPEGELPAYTFMVSLVCRQPVSDPAADFSGLVVCWLGDDVDSSLSQLIDREIRAIEWDRYAVDGWS